ncbi:MAG: helix-turn-helix domain-containing protein [Patescibacteria group bacterium]
MLENKLKVFGLSNHESRVYLAALTLGPSSALDIAKEANIKRATVYLTIEQLVEKGFMHVDYVGLKRKFVAANPEHFEDVVNSLRTTYYDLLPDLLGLYKLKGKGGLVKYYEGLDGLKSLYETILRELRSGDPYYIISKQEHWYELDEVWFEDFVERRAKRALDTRIVFQDSKKARRNVVLQSVMNQKVKLLPSLSAFSSDVIITPQRYVTHSLTHPITAVSIENEDIVKTQISIFLALWNSLPETGV